MWASLWLSIVAFLKAATKAEVIIKFLKEKTITLALKTILKSSVAGGFTGWLVTYIAENLFEELAEPVIRFSFRKAGWLYNRIEGDITLKRVKDAHATNDKNKYIKSISIL